MPPDEGGWADLLFRALGDQTRRRILDLLAEQEPLTVSQLAANFPDLTRANISKHLMALRELELVAATKRGREQFYRINPAAIQRLLYPWVRRYEKYWDERLLRLQAAAEAPERAQEIEP